MDLRDLTVEKYTAQLYYEIDNIEFNLEFAWAFMAFDIETNEMEVDIWLELGEQYISGVRHPFIPALDELKEIYAAIKNVIKEDPDDYDVLQWVEDERDYYNDLNNDRDDR